jgi:hypothetical protein
VIDVILKWAFHVLGLSTVLTASLFLCWVFYMISAQGHLVVYENNLWIRIGECGLAVVGVVYALYLLAVFILKSKR